MHAHMHICTDIEPPSAPAAPRLASPCLPPSLLLPLDLLFCLCSHSDPPTTTSTFPPTSRDCCFSSPPWVFRGCSCAVSLASMPLSLVLLVWLFTGGSDYDLRSRQTRPPSYRTLSSRGRPLPSSHASSSFFTGISYWTYT